LSPHPPTPSETEPPRYRIAARELCEFTAKHGDLDLRFTPAPSALEGIAGHASVAARRGDDYQKELPLRGRYGALEVRGRADGYYPARQELEEVKTYRGRLERLPENQRALHWAQLKIYGWLLCQTLELAELRLSLVYFNVDSEQETLFSERHGAEGLREFFETQCARFLHWSASELAHRAQRDPALAAAAFPHPQFHAGQRQFAEAVYRTAARGGCLLAQAPTGIGKSIGSLYPALKALARGEIEKVFFLTAKTSGRRLALDAAASLVGTATTGAIPLRVLELVAREKSCEHPDKACHGESCPLARGFYDRLPAARAAAVQRQHLDQAGLRAVALEHQVCPYYLGQELVRWSDVVVGDYNYYFDGSALLYGLAQLNDWKLAVLVDEAHNLVERARGMYSAELDPIQLSALRRAAPAELRKPLDKVQRAWNRLHRDQTLAYVAHAQLPDSLSRALQEAVSAIARHYLEEPPANDSPLQAWFFDAAQFLRLVESYSATHSLFEIVLEEAAQPRQPGRSRLAIRNLVPAPFLAPRAARTQALVLFSATLSPPHYYRDLLGLPAGTQWLDVPSPFRAEQLRVKVARTLSTRYQHRQRSLPALIARMAAQYQEQPGNYLAYFSSFDYLQQAAAMFSARYPEIPVWSQQRGMREPERDAFLQRFVVGGEGIGFAVLGGVFAEGIDLPGERLIGAFIASLGLPQINPLNEELRRRLDAQFGAGYDYAYLYPGLQKVVQAAGRVIRGAQDRGVLHLLDDRYAQAEVRALLPSWWHIE
jgi:DNA excision repair protein ERCC-2